ncbi:hypothetical protein F383_37657 [Gossypium arboreum]|uniref:Uncharacterized protein n=1 Tax=Gossypium arboreum TaxID=29729 RepID=A0A0B0MG46_GOSAR|nr:hypothetical protein F383_37657 [Gossypium arboreum]
MDHIHTHLSLPNSIYSSYILEVDIDSYIYPFLGVPVEPY